jgi:hypothetical protein
MTYQELSTLSPDFIRPSAMTSGHLIWLCEKNEQLLQAIIKSTLVIRYYPSVTGGMLKRLTSCPVGRTSMDKQQPTWEYSYF